MRPLILLLFATLVAASPARATVCPASDALCNSGDMYGETAFTTTDPTFYKICSGPVMNTEDVTFDLPSGHFDMGVGEGGGMRLWLRDVFTVTGPPAGTPVTLHMRIRVHGYVNWDGTCCPDSQTHVDITPLEPQPGDAAAHWSFGRTSGPYDQYPFSDSLDIALARTAGAPIGIEIHGVTDVWAPSSARLIADFSFVGLPPGATVTSCKGYRQEQPVPAAPASWGRVKAIYR